MSSVQYQFLSPHWIWLLPLFWLYYLWWYRQTLVTVHEDSIADADPAAANFFYHPLVKALLHEQKKGQIQKQRPIWKKPGFWWPGSAISALIVALAQPVLIGERLPDPPPERDIVFLVDTSTSMQLKDYSLDGKPISRMDLLRNLLNKFADEMKGEQLSVIVFAEQSFVLVPLSHDQYLIKQMLSRISTTLAGRYTAVGDALLLALKETQKQMGRHQTFILFSDADVSRGHVTSSAAAELVADKKIPVFTIAIGSSQQQNVQGQKKVQGGLYQAVNLPLLQEIADITGGKSYQVHDSKAMKQALQSILQQRQNLAEPKPQYKREPLYFYPLAAGLLMILLWQLRRLLHADKSPKKWGGVR